MKLKDLLIAEPVIEKLLLEEISLQSRFKAEYFLQFSKTYTFAFKKVREYALEKYEIKEGETYKLKDKRLEDYINEVGMLSEKEINFEYYPFEINDLKGLDAFEIASLELFVNE